MGDVIKPMSEEELLECLRKFCPNTVMSIDDIKSPKPPFIVTVFTKFLESLVGNVDFLYTPPFKVSDSIENYEWYEELLPLTTLKVLTSYMMQFSGITDLNIKDILEPKPKRTKKILNYLIALWTYVLIKDTMFEEMREKYQEEIDRKLELVNEIDLTTERMNNMLLSIEKKKELEPVYHENKEKSELQARSKDALNETHQKLKNKQANYIKKLRDIDVQIETQKVKLEELDQKILKSPDRLDAAKEDLRQKMLDVDNKTREIQSKSVMQKKLNGDLTDACELLTMSSEKMKTICSLVEELNEAAAAVNLSVHKQKEEEGNAKRMHIELEKEEEQKYLSEQWLGKENLNAKKRVAALQEIMIMDKEASKKAESTCERNHQVVAKLQELRKAANQTIASEEEQHKIYVSKVNLEYALLKKSFVEYSDYIGKMLESEIEKNIDPMVLGKIKRALGRQKTS